MSLGYTLALLLAISILLVLYVYPGLLEKIEPFELELKEDDIAEPEFGWDVPPGGIIAVRNGRLPDAALFSSLAWSNLKPSKIEYSYFQKIMLNDYCYEWRWERVERREW